MIQDAIELKSEIEILTGWCRKHWKTKSGKAMQRLEQKFTINYEIKAGAMDLMDGIDGRMKTRMELGLRWAEESTSGQAMDPPSITRSGQLKRRKPEFKAKSPKKRKSSKGTVPQPSSSTVLTVLIR